MNAVFAFECFADGDVFLVLRDSCQLPIAKRHAGSQGEVVNAVIQGRAQIGMVDEDPMSTHHGARERMKLIHISQDIDLREQSERHLIVIKPELEECFLRSASLVDFKSTLSPHAGELRRRLGRERSKDHEAFRRELLEVHRLGKERRVRTFIEEIVELLRKVLHA